MWKETDLIEKRTILFQAKMYCNRKTSFWSEPHVARSRSTCKAIVNRITIPEQMNLFLSSCSHRDKLLPFRPAIFSKKTRFYKHYTCIRNYCERTYLSRKSIVVVAVLEYITVLPSTLVFNTEVYFFQSNPQVGGKDRQKTTGTTVLVESSVMKSLSHSKN